MKEKIMDKVTNYITKERKIGFFTTLIIALIAHFTCYTQLVATTDTYANGSYYLPGEWEISLGRWGIYFLNILRFGIVSPFLISFISFIILGIISILISDLLKIKSKTSIILISMIIATSPYVCNILLFTYTADTYFIAMLLSVLAVKLLLDESKIHSVYGIICIIFSFSIYQIFLSFTICLICTVLFLEYIKAENNFKYFFKKTLYVILDIILALVLYYIITKLILNVLNIEMADYFGMQDNIKYILKNLLSGISGAYEDWKTYYLSDLIITNTQYYTYIAYFILFILVYLNFTIIILNKNNNFEGIFVKILIWHIIFLTLPIMQNIIRLLVPGSALVPTTTISYIIPILMYVVSLDIIFDNKIMIKKINYIGIIAVCYLIYVYILSGEATYISIEKNYNQIHSQLIRVIDRMENNEQYTEDMKIKIVGGKDYSVILPIYELAGLNTRVGFYGRLGNPPLTYLKEEFGIKNEFATDEEMEEIYETEEYKEMKEFPDKTSVRVINNIMVVKLEENVKNDG